MRLIGRTHTGLANCILWSELFVSSTRQGIHNYVTIARAELSGCARIPNYRRFSGSVVTGEPTPSVVTGVPRRFHDHRHVRPNARRLYGLLGPVAFHATATAA